MIKKLLIMTAPILLAQGLAAQIHGVFLNNIQYDPEPTPSGFERGTTQFALGIIGQTTSDDIAYTPTDPSWEPLRVEITVTNFTFNDLTVAANNISTASWTDPTNTNTWISHQPYYDWAFAPGGTNIIIGTQNQVIPGVGNDPSAINPNSTGALFTSLDVPANLPHNTVIGIEYELIVPSYYIGNTTNDDYISAFTISNSVPEPSSTILIGFGFLALFARRKR